MRRANFSRVVFRWWLSLWPLVWLLAVIPGVAADQESRQQQRATAAKNLFEQTVKDYHLPSAEAQGDRKSVV